MFPTMSFFFFVVSTFNSSLVLASGPHWWTPKRYLPCYSMLLWLLIHWCMNGFRSFPSSTYNFKFGHVMFLKCSHLCVNNSILHLEKHFRCKKMLAIWGKCQTLFCCAADLKTDPTDFLAGLTGHSDNKSYFWLAMPCPASLHLHLLSLILVLTSCWHL